MQKPAVDIYSGPLLADMSKMFRTKGRSYIAEETEKWGKVVKFAGMKPE